MDHSVFSYDFLNMNEFKLLCFYGNKTDSFLYFIANIKNIYFEYVLLKKKKTLYYFISK